MSWFKNSRIDPSTGRNKRDKSPLREPTGMQPRRTIGTGRITDRAASARKMRVERAMRKRGR